MRTPLPKEDCLMTSKSILKTIFSIMALVSTIMSFDLDDYRNFSDQNKNLNEAVLIEESKSEKPYFSEINDSCKNYLYLDSITQKYNLNSNELQLLSKNNFVVTERVSFDNFGTALRDIFNKDLPIFLTTDAVLYTLHLSYDAILIQIEKTLLQPTIKNIITNMRKVFSTVKSRYPQPELQRNLSDVDVYLTIAASMINGTAESPVMADQQEIEHVLSAIKSENYVTMPLFCDTLRELDFSQFKVRGHYNKAGLQNYFRTMMWLGRTDFMLTSPMEGDKELFPVKDIRRMSIDAILLSEVLNESGSMSELASIDSLLSFFIGESDNLTPVEFCSILKSNNIRSADALLSEPTFKSLQSRLSETPEAGQKILNQIICTNQSDTNSLQLPVSFLLMGQKFIVDSYIFGNVIYDKIIYNNKAMQRLMPDPLDVMYSLGNDDAAILLKPELEKWHYASQLKKMRYLIDSYDQNFWRSSLYNCWLNTLRTLNPSAYPSMEKQPLFMRSAAWHQKTLNTQLVSWSQLRHDNLLYAKQSYTPGEECSYPHGFVEPYPAFYKEIGVFAKKAAQYLDKYSDLNYIANYYRNVINLMDTICGLAEKEITKQPFSIQDSTFMANMLVVDHLCGAPITKGWYGNLIFDNSLAEDKDFTIADVHTQPTDESGARVGKVLHVGTGKINLGIFLAQSPSSNYKPMAYAGPVASYYQKVTANFLRHTDEEWSEMVDSNSVPQRPDWVNCFLANSSGARLPQGRIIDGIKYSTTSVLSGKSVTNSNNLKLFQLNSSLIFSLTKETPVQISFYDLRGRLVKKTITKVLSPGNHSIDLPSASGILSAIVQYDGKKQRLPIVSIR